MIEERTLQDDDPLVMVNIRNKFYRQKFHIMLAVFLFGLIAIAILTTMLVYIVKHPPRPLYFATDDAGRFIMDLPLQQPNMPVADVAAWVVNGVQAAYSYDFMNFHSQLQDAQKYFTDYGWRAYMKGLDASNNLLALNTRKQVAIARVVGQPKLLIEGPVGKAKIYGWKFQMQLLVTYLMPPGYDDKNKFSNPLIVTVIVERQNILSSYNGLGIVQMVAELAQTTTPQALPAAPTT
ncbi:MAG: DotI/IcmL/TraM family protein [Pseudomonadota bacterium]